MLFSQKKSKDNRMTVSRKNSFMNFWQSIRRSRIRMIFFVITMLLSVGLGFLSSAISPLAALGVGLLPIVVYLLGILLDNMDWLPLFILLLAAFMPYSLSTGTESRIVFSLVVTVLFFAYWLLEMFVVDKKFSLLPSKMNLPLIGFILAVLVSLAWSNFFRDPFVFIWPSFPLVQIASTVVMVMLPILYLLAANHIHDLRVVKVMIGVMFVASVLGLIKMYGEFEDFPVNTDGMFNMWVIALTFSFAVFNNKAPLWFRLGLLGIAGAWVYWGLVKHIEWLAGWVPGVIVVGVITFFRSKRIILVSAFIVVVVILFNTGYFVEFVQEEYEWSGLTRLDAWAQNWNVTGKHWLFGTGPAGYAAYYMSYWPRSAMATHSNYIDILAQNGVVGLSFLLWFFFALAWYGFKLVLRVRGRNDFWESLVVALFAGCIGCIVMMAFGDWILPFAYTQTIAGYDHAAYSWLLLAALPIIGRLLPEQKKTEAHESQNELD